MRKLGCNKGCESWNRKWCSACRAKDPNHSAHSHQLRPQTAGEAFNVGFLFSWLLSFTWSFFTCCLVFWLPRYTSYVSMHKGLMIHKRLGLNTHLNFFNVTLRTALISFKSVVFHCFLLSCRLHLLCFSSTFLSLMSVLFTLIENRLLHTALVNNAVRNEVIFTMALC